MTKFTKEQFKVVYDFIQEKMEEQEEIFFRSGIEAENGVITDEDKIYDYVHECELDELDTFKGDKELQDLIEDNECLEPLGIKGVRQLSYFICENFFC